MSSTKNILALGLLAKVEPSYSGAVSLSTGSDGIQVAELPEFSIEYTYDGGRSFSQGIAGTQRRVGPSGRFTTATVKVEGKGAGAAYTTASTPPMHALLLASGLSGSVSGGLWTYVPSDVNVSPTSLAMEVYSRGEKRVVKGAYSDLTIEADSAAPPVFTFGLQGIMGIPSTAAAPTITYPATTVVPPKAENITLSIGGTNSFKVRSFKFELGREITPRVDLDSTGGFAGYAPGRRTPKLTVTVEAEALSTFDPYNGFANATQYAVSLGIGSVTNNKYTLSAPQAQLMNVTDGADGPVATWELVFDCPASAPATNDDFSLAFA